MMKMILSCKRAVLLLAIAAAGCSLTPATPTSMKRYELDIPAPKSAAALPISNITLRAPNWLDNAHVAYRLRYNNSARREFYSLSRWVAPPSELVVQALRRGVPQGSDWGSGCRLKVDLDEFVQEFETAQQSEARIAARVRLSPPRGEAGAVTKQFEIILPAGFADAQGGVQALNLATTKWLAEIRTWLASVAATPEGRVLCKG